MVMQMIKISSTSEDLGFMRSSTANGLTKMKNFGARREDKQREGSLKIREVRGKQIDKKRHQLYRHYMWSARDTLAWWLRCSETKRITKCDVLLVRHDQHQKPDALRFVFGFNLEPYLDLKSVDCLLQLRGAACAGSVLLGPFTKA